LTWELFSGHFRQHDQVTRVARVLQCLSTRWQSDKHGPNGLKQEILSMFIKQANLINMVFLATSVNHCSFIALAVLPGLSAAFIISILKNIEKVCHWQEISHFFL
jgi:hypothetical protein